MVVLLIWRRGWRHIGVEWRLAGEHGAGHGEQAVGDAAHGAAVTVIALAQFGVAATAELAVLDGNAGPGINGAAQPQMASVTHDDMQCLPLRLVTGVTPDKVRKA